jgi:hypothetical protein
VCILGHVSSIWFLSSLLRASADEIDDRIAGIDNGLGFLAQKMLDPDHWADVIGSVRPEMNPVEMLLNHFISDFQSPRDDYSRDDDGRFYGTTTQIIDATTQNDTDGDLPIGDR